MNLAYRLMWILLLQASFSILSPFQMWYSFLTLIFFWGGGHCPHNFFVEWRWFHHSSIQLLPLVWYLFLHCFRRIYAALIGELFRVMSYSCCCKLGPGRTYYNKSVWVQFSAKRFLNPCIVFLLNVLSVNFFLFKSQK